jgi:hypothetical protein
MNFPKYILIIIFQLFIFNNGKSQNKLDSILNTLHNKDLKTELAIVLHDTYRMDDRGIQVSGGWRIGFPDRVEGFSGDIASKLDTMFRNKFLLINKLFGLLDDPERDFYSDLLLYELTRIVSDLIPCETRDDWFKVKFYKDSISIRDHDIQFWKKYSVGMAAFKKYYF